MIEALSGAGFDAVTIDGELLVVRDGLVQPFGVLQQRLNRKTVSAKLIAEYPLHIRAYDLLLESSLFIVAVCGTTASAALATPTSRVRI